MPIVNYVSEHTQFIEWATDEQLSGSERLLWYALMHIFNQRAQGRYWPDGFIRIANDRLLAYTGMKFDAMAAARNRLSQRRRIEYMPGKGSEKGKAKSISPLYKLNYFCTEIADHTEKTDGYGDGMGDGRGDGTRDGLGRGRGDITINVNETRDKPDQTEGEEDNPTTEETRAGARRYPKRQRSLTDEEFFTLERIRGWLEANRARDVYGRGYGIIGELLESDRFPLGLVSYAIGKTLERNEKYETPLANAAAYTEKLLADWDERGFQTIDDVKQSKDDYS